jgi:glutathione S-transferase
MLTLYGRANSINVQKAFWALEEAGVPYRRLDVGGAFGGNDTPEYLARNPNGRVPMLEDGSFTLWESNAIARYVAAKYGGGTLWPDTIEKRADADRWMDWQQTTLNPGMTPVFWGLVRTPPEQRDQAAIAKGIEQTAAAFAILDKALSGRAYITGDTFTVGDIPVGCGTHRWLNLPIARAKLPNVERWYASLMTRPAARKVLITPLT